ncbi:mother-specific HO expression [Conoideocrella luteorostrata]|uniref:Mother-specific HO expression n=1 Tax=Conoideocrella luteorostrata TaxID=1105319 RepID=A0AAJ0CTC7_9HYPO|nr:mother-specific HO expression [Conoideocrella luteorostrata]
MNTMTAARPAPTHNAAKHALSRTATIRSVPSFEGSESSPDSKRSAFASSINSTASAVSAMEGNQHDKAHSASRLKQDLGNETVMPSRWNSNGVRTIEPSLPHDTSIVSEEADNGHWDSTIGKAGLGKTGRVINKLVSDNDALKRDIQIERLRAEEAKQAAKLVEDKMERMMNEYEGRLLEANVTKTLLARKERQVESLTAAVELEKRKTQAAQNSERSWKKELDKVKSDSTLRVDEATNYAQLMEGRYNAISSHWRDHGEEVKRTVTKLRGDIDTIVGERKLDDDKITTLRDLCEQQDNNIKELRREKEEIAHLFEEYKKMQEDDLRDIKTNARQRQEEQEKQLEEAREALHKLKWALNVKQNVKGAQ